LIDDDENHDEGEDHPEHQVNPCHGSLPFVKAIAQATQAIQKQAPNVAIAVDTDGLETNWPKTRAPAAIFATLQIVWASRRRCSRSNRIIVDLA